MEIGQPQRTIVVEPLEEPAPTLAPVEAPVEPTPAYKPALEPVGSEMVAPDLIEPIIGWRARYLGGGGDGFSLFSVIHQHDRWPAGFCLRGGLRARPRGTR